MSVFDFDDMHDDRQAKIEKKGRGGDKLIAHLTPGEIVIPRAFAENDTFRAVLAESFRENGINLEEFIVGSGKNKTNPETGYLEFGFFKKLNPFRRHSFFRAWFDPALKNVLALPKKTKEALFPPPPKMPPLPEPAAPTPRMTTQEAELAKRRVRASAKRRIGYAAMVKTREKGLGTLATRKARTFGA